MRKTLAALGLSAGLLGGGAAGFVLGTPVVSGAETSSDGATSAAAPGAGTVMIRDDDWMASALAPLVSDGTITQAQADAVTAALQAARPAPGMRVGHLIADLDTAAQAIGIDADALRQALRDGQTLAEVAQANGVEPQAVTDALVSSARTRIADDVAAGRISQEDADRLLADLESHISDVVNGVAPPGPPDGLPARVLRDGGPGVGRGALPAPDAPSPSQSSAEATTA
jgi:hypothetical protein